MIIDNLVFFIWVIVFVSIGVAVAFSGRHKAEYAPADNVRNEDLLSFPQRHWFLIVVVVAILSPLVFSWVQAAARHRSHQQSVEQPGYPAAGNAATGSGNAATDSGTKDTSYHVATPPQR